MEANGRFSRKHPIPQFGDRFGEYAVIAPVFKPTGGVKGVFCMCSCTWMGLVDIHSLVSGRSTRCDKCAFQKAAETRRIYEKDTSEERHQRRLLTRISAAIGRCTDPLNRQYPQYGGRGIGVYSEWLRDRRLWLEHLYSLPGWDDPQATCDRIDNDRGYEPGNIRFVSHRKQQSNKRQTVWIEYAGKRMSGVEFWKEFCPRYRTPGTVLRKIREGKSPEQVIRDQELCKGAYRKGVRLAERRPE